MEHEITLTAREQHLKDAYTYAVEVNPDDPEEQYEVELRIGAQSFRLGLRFDVNRADWYRSMLAKALATFEERECENAM